MKTTSDRVISLLGAASILSFLAVSPVKATTLIGNIPANGNASFDTIGQVFVNIPFVGPTLISNNAKAASFTTPLNTTFQLDNVILTLNDLGANDRPIVQIRDSAGINPGTNILATLTRTSPPPAGGTNTNYTFTPTSPFSFLPNTTYWLYVGGASPTGTQTFQNFNWRGAILPANRVTPTGIGTFNDFRFSFNGGSTWGAGNLVNNSLQINVTRVPEPSALIGLFTVTGVAILSRRKLG